MKRIIIVITFMLALSVAKAQIDDFGGFGGFGDFPDTGTTKSEPEKTSGSVGSLPTVASPFGEEDVEVTKSEFDEAEEGGEERLDRYKSPMKFTRRELNKISDPRIRDLYWYALNDTTDRKRYLRAHYAFNEWQDNWAFEVRAGVHTVTMNNIKTEFKIGPELEFAFKKDLHPYWAIRADLTWSKFGHMLYTDHISTMIKRNPHAFEGYEPDVDKETGEVYVPVWGQDIEYKNIGLRGGVMLNLINLYAGREMLYSPLAAYVYAGAGFCYSFVSLSDRNGSCMVPNWFGGAQFAWNFGQRYSAILDVNAAWQSDDMEGLTTQNSTFKYVATIGLSYKFSKIIHFQRLGYDESFIKPQVVDSEGDDMVMQSIIETDTPAELPSDMIQAAFFQIDRIELQHTYVLNLGFYAQLIKSHPDQKFLVKGFADVEVGSMKRNLWLSEQRAKVVADVLIKTYECNPDQLVIGGGDLDYDIPFLREEGHHRFNRCTIVCPLDKDYKIIKENSFDDKSELMDGRPGYERPEKNY